MSKRKRLSGKERREMRRRARQPMPWLTWQVTAAALAGGAIVLGALLFAVFVLADDDGVSSKATVEVTPRLTPTVDRTGPPPTNLQPTVTGSGLAIIDLEVGDGTAAETGKSVTVNYTGWLKDGTKFSTSQDSGGPFTVTELGSGGVIPGWDEGIVGMKVGGKRRLIIPPALAYGADGRPPTIPANAELTFDVELLSVAEPPPATPTPATTPAATPTP